MKRKAALGTGILTMVLCLAMGFTAYAQGWEQDGNGWWYSTDSGYLSNGLFRRRRLYVHRLGAGWRKVVLHGRFRRDAGKYHYAGR